MPRTKKKEEVSLSPELKVSEEVSLKDIVSSLNGLVDAVKSIKEEVDTLKGKTDTAVNVSVENKVEQAEVPVPNEYRELVDLILNKSFGIQIEPRSDIPAFFFKVVVPEKYSSCNKEYLKTYKYDLRPKVITYGEGSNGVREWCETVFNNFNPDMRALITADRFK